MDVRTQG